MLFQQTDVNVSKARANTDRVADDSCTFASQRADSERASSRCGLLVRTVAVVVIPSQPLRTCSVRQYI
jgi:hypothetical protein